MDNQGSTIKSRPKEFFLHFLAIITLYISAGSFITLLFQFWNYFLPDLAQNQYTYDSWLWPMRTAVASLIIVFPVFAGVSKFLQKLYAAEPVLRDLRVRRWLLNFTLFVAALVIIGDLITVIYNFISGEIALRFILKAFSVLSVAALIFGYYFMDLRNDLAEGGLISKRSKQIIIYISVLGVFAGIVGSFFVMGSPFEARERNIDGIRVSNLQTIQYEIINFWQAKGTIPKTLDELNDATRGVSVPADPETGEPYIYKTTGDLSFDLCAEFKTASDKTAIYPQHYPYGGVSNDWAHGAGETCFHRPIDKDFYQPYPKKG